MRRTSGFSGALKALLQIGADSEQGHADGLGGGVDEFGDPLDGEDADLLATRVAARFSEAAGNSAVAPLDAAAIAHYMIACGKHLQAQETQLLLGGALQWPDPLQQQG